MAGHYQWSTFKRLKGNLVQTREISLGQTAEKIAPAQGFGDDPGVSAFACRPVVQMPEPSTAARVLRMIRLADFRKIIGFPVQSAG